VKLIVMKEFRLKHVEAVRVTEDLFDLSDDSIVNIYGCIIDKDNKSVRVPINFIPLFQETAHQIAHVGQWIVRKGGRLKVYEDDEFNELYEEVL